MAKPVYLVYGLIDPETRLVMYIGKSVSGLTRPKAHRKKRDGDKTPCAEWVRSLQSRGFDFEITVLEHTTKSQLNEVECWWIAYGRLSDWPLTNQTAGGGGLLGWHQPESFIRRMKEVHTGKIVTQETRDKLSRAQLGRVVTPETRERIGAYHRGRPKTPEHRAKIGAAQRGKFIPLEARQKCSQTLRGRPWSPARRAAQERLNQERLQKRESWMLSVGFRYISPVFCWLYLIRG